MELGPSYFNQSVANVYLEMVMTEGHSAAVPTVGSLQIVNCLENRLSMISVRLSQAKTTHSQMAGWGRPDRSIPNDPS